MFFTSDFQVIMKKMNFGNQKNQTKPKLDKKLKKKNKNSNAGQGWGAKAVLPQRWRLESTIFGQFKSAAAPDRRYGTTLGVKDDSQHCGATL